MHGRCVLEETQEEPDPKLKMEHGDENVIGGEDKENVVGDEEESGGAGDTVEEDSDDYAEAWDENGDPCLPFIGCWDPPVVLLCTAGVLPKITTTCASGHECYHRWYWTEITFETASTHPYFRPCGMMQVFSLRLSSLVAHPVNIYGRFAVRDCWEPLRNYIFKRSRDDPATIPQGCSFLPLRSPCRGIYVLQCILLDNDLWIKEDGDGSADKPLFCGYVELDASKAVFGSKLDGQFQGDYHGLDMHYTFLWDSIETVIEVLAGPEHSSDIRFTASTSGFDDEVELYDGTFCGKGTIFRHFMAVKKQEELHVVLKTDDSLYKWTFQARVGVVVAPEHPISCFA